MAVRFDAVVFEVSDPHRMGSFWADVLGWTSVRVGENSVSIEPAGGIAPRIEFRQTATVKRGQNRIHLDITTASPSDQTDSVTAAVAAGARHADVGQSPEEDHVVLADPEDNEFCILAPYNSFLAGTGRLGSINCDGTRDLGVFWSAALGWPLMWDQNEETAIRSPQDVPFLITWSGPPLMPRHGVDRQRLRVAAPGMPRAVAVAELVALGARIVVAATADAGVVVLHDPDGNEFELAS